MIPEHDRYEKGKVQDNLCHKNRCKISQWNDSKLIKQSVEKVIQCDHVEFSLAMPGDLIFSWVQFGHSVVSDSLDCSMPGFLIHHQLLELAQTLVHWVGDVIQSSHPLSSPSPPAFNLQVCLSSGKDWRFYSRKPIM